MIEGKATVMRNLDAYMAEMLLKMRGGMQRAMTEAENHSKQTAPWRDRTGNARNSIFGHASNDKATIIGYHGIGVFYGKYLELSNQGRYRVIWPTMDWLRPKLLGLLAGR